MNSMEKLAISMMGKLLLGAGLLGGGSYLMSRGGSGPSGSSMPHDLFANSSNMPDVKSSLDQLPIAGGPQDIANRLHDERVVRELGTLRAVLGEKFR